MLDKLAKIVNEGLDRLMGQPAVTWIDDMFVESASGHGVNLYPGAINWAQPEPPRKAKATFLGGAIALDDDGWFDPEEGNAPYGQSPAMQALEAQIRAAQQYQGNAYPPSYYQNLLSQPQMGPFTPV